MNKEVEIILWVFFIVMILSVCAVCVLSYDLSPGENYTYAYNGTGNESFLCEMPGMVSWEFILEPGETKNETFSSCQARVTCAACADEEYTGLCSLDKGLDPGESFEKHTGACDVAFSCAESTEVECAGDDGIVYREKIELFANDREIIFRFGDDEKSFEMNRSACPNFSHEFEAEFLCPNTITTEDFSQGDLFELCSQTNPYLLEWVDLSMKQKDDCELKRNELEAARSSCIDDCRVQTAECEQRNLILMSDLETKKRDASRFEEERNAARADSDMKDWVIALFLCWAMAATILGIIFWKNKEVNV